MTVVFKKQTKYDVPPDIQNVLDKYAFDIHEFSEHKKIRTIIPLAEEIKKMGGSWIYVTQLKDVIEIDDVNKYMTYKPYFLVINGEIIYSEYLSDVKKLIELEQKYN